MKKKSKKKEINIVESVEFLSEEDMLVAELDKRLSFSVLGDKATACPLREYVCPSFCPCNTQHVPPAVAGVRG